MWNAKRIALSLVVLSSVVLLVALGAPRYPLQGSTWGIWFGDPSSSGTHETTITFSYSDSAGVKKEKEVKASVSLGNADTPEGKKTKVQNALNDALSAEGNTVDGEPLASTGGNGNAMTITPSSSIQDAKIKSIKTKDGGTGEEDKIIKPGKKGLAEVEPEGELLGRTAEGNPSVFFVTTNLGLASVNLTPGMKKVDLLKALKTDLLALDPATSVWVDTSRMVLFVLLPEGDDESIWQIGAGSSDEGLAAVCKVMISE